MTELVVKYRPLEPKDKNKTNNMLPLKGHVGVISSVMAVQHSPCKQHFTTLLQ